MGVLGDDRSNSGATCRDTEYYICMVLLTRRYISPLGRLPRLFFLVYHSQSFRGRILRYKHGRDKVYRRHQHHENPP